MNIIIDDTKITIQVKGMVSPYTLLSKPDIADYGNTTARPLVKSYHLVRESIWERFVRCVQDLENHCQNDSHSICYFMLFGALYVPLLASSQTKNVLFYGNAKAAPFLAVLQDFMTFLHTDSSLTVLPENPFVFSGLANGSWYAAVIDLDLCRGMQTICDIIIKVRKGGTILLYTALRNPDGDIASLLSYAEKTSLSSCTLYQLDMNAQLNELVYPYTTEAFVLTRTEELLTQIDEVRRLIQSLEQDTGSPEESLAVIDLLRRMEDSLFALYDYLEDPELPLCANMLKEAVMDHYIGIHRPADTAIYWERVRLAAQVFFQAIETEFQC